MKSVRGSKQSQGLAKVVEWRKAARADLVAIADYVAADNLDAAIRLVDEIEEKVGKLAQHPKQHRPGRVEGTRELVVRPNYIVVYAEGDTRVLILRVLHAAQQWPPR